VRRVNYILVFTHHLVHEVKLVPGHPVRWDDLFDSLCELFPSAVHGDPFYNYAIDKRDEDWPHTGEEDWDQLPKVIVTPSYVSNFVDSK